MPRFYDVTAGAVLIDGHDVRDLHLASLRDKIGIVAQDTFLFNDTVANNIALRHARTRPRTRSATPRETPWPTSSSSGCPRATTPSSASAESKLSGGQRQRLAIARALLKNAPILILDEATSHLDTESEMLVQTALPNLMEHRTVIVIAHRLSTIRRADKIVVLGSGADSRNRHARGAGQPRRHLSAAPRTAVPGSRTPW